MHSYLFRGIALVAVLGAASCFSTGSRGPLAASASTFHVTPLPAMVAKKVDIPLYLVVSPADVPDRVHVPGFSAFVFTVPDVDLRDVRAFATRDIKSGFEAYFSTVRVVPDESQVPETPHIVGKVKVARLEYERRVSPGEHGQNNEIYGALEWSFGLIEPNQSEFAFTFSERTVSSQQMKDFNDTSEWENAFQEALRHLLAEYGKAHLHEKWLQSPTNVAQQHQVAPPVPLASGATNPQPPGK